MRAHGAQSSRAPFLPLRGRSLVISPYPKIDISWLITSISEAWKRSSLFIARRPGTCERTRGPVGGKREGNVEITEGDRQSFFRKRSLLADSFNRRQVYTYTKCQSRKDEGPASPIVDRYNSISRNDREQRESIVKERKRKKIISNETFVYRSKPCVQSIVTFPKRSEERRYAGIQ